MRMQRQRNRPRILTGAGMSENPQTPVNDGNGYAERLATADPFSGAAGRAAPGAASAGAGRLVPVQPRPGLFLSGRMARPEQCESFGLCRKPVLQAQPADFSLPIPGRGQRRSLPVPVQSLSPGRLCAGQTGDPALWRYRLHGQNLRRARTDAGYVQRRHLTGLSFVGPHHRQPLGRFGRHSAGLCHLLCSLLLR